MLMGVRAVLKWVRCDRHETKPYDSTRVRRLRSVDRGMEDPPGGVQVVQGPFFLLSSSILLSSIEVSDTKVYQR